MTRVGVQSSTSVEPAVAGAADAREQDAREQDARERDAGELAARLHVAVGRLVRVLRRHGDGDLGPGSLSALVTLARSGPMRLGDLAGRENVAPATLTRIVASMEAGGLVVRRPDPDDRRAWQVAATDAGTALTSGVSSARVGALQARLHALTAQQRAALEQALPVLEELARED